MKPHRPPTFPAPPDGEMLLGLAADSSLRDDPRLLHNPERLGALHAELLHSLGVEDTAATLLQAGFLRGLRDALAALRETGHAGSASAPSSRPLAPRCASPRLSLELTAHRSAGDAASPDLEGAWRDGHEAQGRVGRLGPGTEPSCWASAGYTSGWFSGLLGVDLVAVETACAGCGAEVCRFRLRSPEVWAQAGDPGAARIVARLEIRRLREAVASPERAPAADGEGDLDPEAAAVHVWGPVMVIPFGGPDESLAALELIGRDESARDVSVVVVDLGGAILDEGWGAVALERVLEAVEGWGAEAVLAGVSPLSAGVVEELADRHLVLHKELPEAVAAAFQIADAQRRVY